MKKILLTIILLFTILLAGCNYDLLDVKYDFDYAMIKMPDGTVKTIELKSWADSDDGEQLTLTDKDGNIYLVNSVNCILVKEK